MHRPSCLPHFWHIRDKLLPENIMLSAWEWDSSSYMNPPQTDPGPMWRSSYQALFRAPVKALAPLQLYPFSNCSSLRSYLFPVWYLTALSMCFKLFLMPPYLWNAADMNDKHFICFDHHCIYKHWQLYLALSKLSMWMTKEMSEQSSKKADALIRYKESFSALCPSYYTVKQCHVSASISQTLWTYWHPEWIRNSFILMPLRTSFMALLLFFLQKLSDLSSH